MNERIYELALQAEMAANNGNHVDVKIMMAKFGALIIQEMYQVMKAEGEQFSLDQNLDALKGVGRCMRKVKEHFGVDQ